MWYDHHPSIDGRADKRKFWGSFNEIYVKIANVVVILNLQKKKQLYFSTCFWKQSKRKHIKKILFNKQNKKIRPKHKTCDEYPNTAHTQISYTFFSFSSDANQHRIQIMAENQIQYASRIHLNANQKELGCGLFMLFTRRKRKNERKKEKGSILYGFVETEWHGNRTQWKKSWR